MSNTIDPIILSDGTIKTAPYGYGHSAAVSEPEKTKKPDGKYYESSIASLDTKEQKAQAEKPKSTGFFGWCESVYNWVSDFISGKSEVAIDAVQAGEESTNVAEGGSVPLNPELKPPAKYERSKTYDSLLQQQRDLARILDEQYQEYEELEKLGNISFEVFLQRATHKAFMLQREIKEQMALEDSERLQAYQKEKKDINNQKFALVDDYLEKAKTNTALHWVNFATTVGILGLAAVVAAPVILGTAALSAAAMSAIGYANSFLLISKGGVSLGEAYTKHRTDKLSGDIFMMKHDSKVVDSKIKNRVAMVKDTLDENQRLFRIFQQILESKRETVRGFTTQINQ
jgi:hypothetical protein